MPERHRPRKRFGQHFLVDDYAIETILQCVAADPPDHVLEIGPGAGALTAGLVDSGATVDLVEIDRDLAAELRTRYRGLPRVTVHQADVLEFDFGLLADRAPAWKVVGNLPYNISTPLILRLLARGALWSRLVLMVQREVAARMAARPGSGDYGRLSIAVQRRCAIRERLALGPDSFDPPPKVDSVVVELVPIAGALAPPVEERLDELLRVAFAGRRKTVANALRGRVDRGALTACGIDPGLRPQEIDIAAWLRLASFPDA